MENASRKFSYREVKSLIDAQKENGWEFIFLGANIDAAEVAEHIGIDASRAVNYHADSQGTGELFEAVSDFVAESRMAPSFLASRPGKRWRESIDKDFSSRKK